MMNVCSRTLVMTKLDFLSASVCRKFIKLTQTLFVRRSLHSQRMGFKHSVLICAIQFAFGIRWNNCVYRQSLVVVARTSHRLLSTLCSVFTQFSMCGLSNGRCTRCWCNNNTISSIVWIFCLFSILFNLHAYCVWFVGWIQLRNTLVSCVMWLREDERHWTLATGHRLCVAHAVHCTARV